MFSSFPKSCHCTGKRSARMIIFLNTLFLSKFFFRTFFRFSCPRNVDFFRKFNGLHKQRNLIIGNLNEAHTADCYMPLFFSLRSKTDFSILHCNNPLSHP